MKVNLTVNGEQTSVDVADNALLSDVLRETLGLTGTHIGCDTSQCGACTVHLNGYSVKSCSVLAGRAEGAEITTIEGLANNGELHPMQKAFRANHALQCGFCTPGMIMSAIDLVQSSDGELSADEVRKGLEGNYCRCTGYHNIVKAVLDAQAEM